MFRSRLNGLGDFIAVFEIDRIFHGRRRIIPRIDAQLAACGLRIKLSDRERMPPVNALRIICGHDFAAVNDFHDIFAAGDVIRCACNACR